MLNQAYHPIFLAESWAHQRYFGWHAEDVGPGLRVLTRRYGPVVRTLILLCADGVDYLPNIIRHQAHGLGLYDIIVHDFDNVLTSASHLIARHRFAPVVDKDRLLNVATYAIDISRPDEAILGEMTSDYRRKIRKAEAAGIAVVVYDRPDKNLVIKFVDTLSDFARPRGLNTVDLEVLEAMYAAGDATLFVAMRDGRITNFLHIYTAGDTGQFMYGVNLDKQNDGSGQFLHWQAMCHLRSQGYKWYDLGGVAQDEGIRTFKERFGGQFIDLGMEWRTTGALVSVLTMVRRGLRRAGVPA